MNESLWTPEAARARRIDLWRRATIEAVPAARYVAAHYAIRHPTIGLTGNWGMTLKDAERSLAYCREHGEPDPDVCIAGAPAFYGVCGDPEYVCAPAVAK